MSTKSQLISYVRIATTAIAWFMVRESPVNFGGMWLLSDALSLIELMFRNGSA